MKWTKQRKTIRESWKRLHKRKKQENEKGDSYIEENNLVLSADKRSQGKQNKGFNTQNSRLGRKKDEE